MNSYSPATGFQKTLKLFQALILVITLVSMSFPSSAFATQPEDVGHTPVTICHNGNALTVDDDAVQSHIDQHGDTILHEGNKVDGDDDLCSGDDQDDDVPLSCTLSANPNPITQGNSTTLTLDLAGDDADEASATVDHSVGSLSDNGTAVVSPSGTTTYTATIVGEDNVTCSATVTVNPSDDEGDEEGSDAQCVIVSDEITQEDGAPAVLVSFIHNAWNTVTSALSDASWIWGEDPVSPSDTEKTEIFTRTFSLVSVPTSATLEMSADNGYIVKVNGTTVADELAVETNYNSVHTYNVASLLTSGNNTLEFTVKNFAQGGGTPQSNPAGLIYRLSVDDAQCGEPIGEVDNSCVAPNAEGAPAEIPFGSTPGSEDTLQEILDAVPYTLDAENDQKNFQTWNDDGSDISFKVTNISEAGNSGHRHMFGYYLNGSTTFTPVFRNGAVSGADAGVTEVPYGADTTFTVPGVTSIVFAIADWNTTTYTYFATDNNLNVASEDHAVVYNPADDEYVIAFEDLPFASGDEDYNDIVVTLEVTGCEDAEQQTCDPKEELLSNGGFENPGVTDGSGWDIFASGTANLDWVVAWFGGSATYNSENRPLIANAEFHGGVNGWLPSEGEQYAELDADWNGHSGSLNGEPGAVEMSQTIATIPGENYSFSFDFSARPGTVAAQNKVEVLAGGNSLGFVGPLATAGNQTEWTNHEFSFVATGNTTTVTLRDVGTPNDSLGTFVDNASVICTPKKEEPKITVVASKIVCTDEADLPNWGEGGDSITEDTAQDWVDTHESCDFADGWSFEYGDQSATDAGNAFVGHADGYTTFGPTVAGTVTADIPLSELGEGTEFHLREVLQSGYIPFTYQIDGDVPDGNDVSAEFYCANDVLHYDNFDFIRNPEEGTTYYCVAFNVPVEEEICEPGERWANEVVSTNQGLRKDGSAVLVERSDSSKTLGSSDSAFYSLGFGGSIVLSFDTYIEDVIGDDLVVYEKTNGIYPFETASVAVSQDGIGWQTLSESADNTNGGVTGLDFNETGLAWIRYVRITDTSNTANFPSPAYNNADGFDLDAVKAIYGVCREPESRNWGTLIIEKIIGNYSEGDDDEFEFGVEGIDESFDSTSIQTVEGTGSDEMILEEGEYSLTEFVPTGWTLEDVSCEYGEDSEGESIEDGEEIYIEAGDTVTCTFTNVKDDEDGGGSDEDDVCANLEGVQIEVPKNMHIVNGDQCKADSRRNGGSGGGSSSAGQVLGASTCSALLNDYLKFGWNNDPEEVNKLQQFLNDHLGTTLPLNGVFGPATFEAVKSFQQKYWEEVLKPWFGLAGSGIQSENTPTGFVYQTTRWQINNIWCPGSEAFPQTLN